MIANPDVEFEEDAINECIKLITNHPECAAIAPKIRDGNAFKFALPILDITFSVMTLNKIFKPREYKNNFF